MLCFSTWLSRWISIATIDCTTRCSGCKTVRFGPDDDVVERVPLDGLTPGSADQAADLPGGHRLGCWRTGHVVDAFFLHRAVEIVRAEPERELCGFHPGRDPERLDVRNVVEHQ